MTIYFAPIARLLGDLVVSLPPLQSLVEAHAADDVCLILRSPAQLGLAQRIPGLRHVILENEFLQLPESERKQVFNLRDHPLQTNYVWGSPAFYAKYPGYGISDIIREICHDLGIPDGQNELVSLQYTERADFVGKVLLIPGTAAPIKTWPNSHWLALQRELAAMGKSGVMIGEPRVNAQIASLIQAGMPWAPTRTLADALDAISSAACVVSVDTGLMHLAVHQGVQTVALFRDYTMFLRDYPHSRNLIANDCSAECKRGEFDFCPNVQVFFDDWNADKIFEFWNNMKCKQEQSESCMARISVESVLAKLEDNGSLNPD